MDGAAFEPAAEVEGPLGARIEDVAREAVDPTAAGATAGLASGIFATCTATKTMCSQTSRSVRGVMSPVSRSNAAHYIWGEVSEGWRLVDEQPLSVTEEQVPAGAGETWHVHRRAQQFFYILDGEATMCTETSEVRLTAGEGVTIPPGIAHRFTNPSDAPVRFLVISSPSTRGDRHPVQVDGRTR